MKSRIHETRLFKMLYFEMSRFQMKVFKTRVTVVSGLDLLLTICRVSKKSFWPYFTWIFVSASWVRNWPSWCRYTTLDLLSLKVKSRTWNRYEKIKRMFFFNAYSNLFESIFQPVRVASTLFASEAPAILVWKTAVFETPRFQCSELQRLD